MDCQSCAHFRASPMRLCRAPSILEWQEKQFNIAPGLHVYLARNQKWACNHGRLHEPRPTR